MGILGGEVKFTDTKSEVDLKSNLVDKQSIKGTKCFLRDLSER